MTRITRIGRWVPLGMILFLALMLRLYRINYPLLDWHSWRQSDTASVTREYVKHGISLLTPTYQDLSSIPSGKENFEHGYRMVEFPILNATTAMILKTFSFLPLVPTSRFVSIIFSLGSIALLYCLVEELSGKKVATLSALSFAVLPYSIYYSRTILPEPAMVFFALLGVYGFQRWLSSKKLSWYFASIVTFAVALLLKPFAAFMGPVFLVLAWQKFGKKIIKQPLLAIYPILAFLPLLAWRNWILNFPEGIPASDWLYNSDGARFAPFWFRWIGYERLIKLMLGFVGVIFVPFSFLKMSKKSKDQWVYLAWWLGMAAYVTVLATGNVKHDYYQIIFTPILSITIGRGAVLFYEKSHDAILLLAKRWKTWAHLISLSITAALFFTATILGWQEVKGYFNVNHWEYHRAGRTADLQTPSDAKIIAPTYGGDTAFLFQTNRAGWPIAGSVETRINEGATHYLSTTSDAETKELEEKYFVVEKTQEFTLIDLTKLSADSPDSDS